MFSAYGTFMLRQFFMSLPTDLEDAAKIDGCSLFGIYTKIILPLSKPALATLTIFTFMGSWMSFMWPLIVTNSMELKTLPVMLASFQGLYTTDWTLLMAGSIIILSPIIVVFILGQRYFVEGIKLGAIKG
jgi:multiple sugar transport system permease protein